jgi:predicted phage terminase large subunit-like protein
MDEYARVRKFLLSSYHNFVYGLFYYNNNEREVMNADHHQKICDSIDKCMFSDEPDNNLLINIAPRSGKTMLAVVYLLCFQAALSGGECNTMLASYSTRIAKKSIKDAHDIINTPLFSRLFPMSRIDRFTDGVIRFVSGGEICPVSPRSSLTGLGAGVRANGLGYNGCIIIDDIVNSADSFSVTIRERANEWYSDSLQSRKNDPKTPIICIGQRLHQKDIAGYILEIEPEKYKKIIIPTIDEEKGISFWEEKYPYKNLIILKDKNPFLFWTQYQQKPVGKGAGIFDDSMIHFYDERPRYNKERVFIVADTAQKIKEVHDWTVFQIWQWDGFGDQRRIYLIDQIRVKVKAPELLKLAINLKESWQPAYFFIEDKSSGTGLIQQLAGMYKEEDIIPIPRGAGDNKVCRAMDASIYMAQGRVLLPRDASFIPDLLEEIENFSELMLHSHDDQVDALSDAVKASLIDDLDNFGDWGAFEGINAHNAGFGLPNGMVQGFG